MDNGHIDWEEKMDDKTFRWGTQLIVYILISLAAIGLTAVLVPSSSAYFGLYFGGLHPLLALILVSIAGGPALWFLKSRWGFEIIRGKGTLRGILVSGGCATVLGILIVIADLFIRYPENINVPVPAALGFYPVIGFVVEIVFHVLPMTIILLVLNTLRERFGIERLIWLAIILTAALEPTFQILFSGEHLEWGDLYTWVHIYAISFLQLWVFRRYDFVSMYSFRLIYYAYWHIIWGVLRLELLF
jgi:hypothetical protein